MTRKNLLVIILVIIIMFMIIIVINKRKTVKNTENSNNAKYELVIENKEIESLYDEETRIILFKR